MPNSRFNQTKPYPRRKRLRLPRFDYTQSGHAYFLTLCVRDSRSVFLNQGLAAKVVSLLLNVGGHYGLSVHAYCLMPDHLHWVMSLNRPGRGVSAMVQEFKKLSTRVAWAHGHLGTLWQRSFYDHVVRRDEDLKSVCRYVMENPVRAGLVIEAEQYQLSGMPDPIPV